MGISTTKGALVITGTRSKRSVEIQFFPKELKFDRSAELAEITIVGRNNPLQHYTGGKEKLQFQLDFYSEEKNREDVIEKVNWLKSLTYNEGYGTPPETVLITWGKLFKNNDVWAVAKVTPSLQMFDSTAGFLPRQAYVDIHLVLAPKTNTTAKDVRWRRQV